MSVAGYFFALLIPVRGRYIISLMIDTSQLVPLIGQLKDGMADNQDKFMILSGLNSCIGELNGLLRTANQFFQKPENKAGRGGGNLPEDRS